MKRSLLVLHLLHLLLLLPAGEALATDTDRPPAGQKEEAYPLAVAARPLTLPQHAVELDLYSSGTFIRNVDTISGSAGLVGYYGVTDQLTLEASFLPLGLSPSVVYGPPSLGGTWRFRDGRTEMGVSLRAAIPVEIPGGPVLPLSFSGRLRVRHHLSGETTFKGGVGPWVSRRTVTTFGATADVGITQNFGRHFFLTIDSAVGMGISSISTLFYVPLTLIGGFSLEFSERLIFDSTVYASCPTVLASGRARPLAFEQGTIGVRFGLVFH